MRPTPSFPLLSSTLDGAFVTLNKPVLTLLFIHLFSVLPIPGPHPGPTDIWLPHLLGPPWAGTVAQTPLFWTPRQC